MFIKLQQKIAKKKFAIDNCKYAIIDNNIKFNVAYHHERSHRNNYF